MGDVNTGLPATISAALRHAAERWPGADAVVGEPLAGAPPIRLTYAELDCEVDMWAAEVAKAELCR